ncbi:hypothetical protein [Lysobacter claricitrinus]|uniref:hypothetical protein n=1 Tax=Lysobacter claricitrinus TaxID=3367728 RepID=UPI0037DB9E43
MKRPPTLIAAVLLLAATHIYGITELAQVISTGNLGVAPMLPSAVAAVVYLALLGLVVMVWLGRDWARFICAVAGFLAVLTNAPHLASFDGSAVMWFFAKAAAVALLYVPPTNRWFRWSGPNNSSKPTPLRGAA